jgi:hypothetical protein
MIPVDCDMNLASDAIGCSARYGNQRLDPPVIPSPLFSMTPDSLPDPSTPLLRKPDPKMLKTKSDQAAGLFGEGGYLWGNIDTTKATWPLAIWCFLTGYMFVICFPPGDGPANVTPTRGFILLILQGHRLLLCDLRLVRVPDRKLRSGASDSLDGLRISLLLTRGCSWPCHSPGCGKPRATRYFTNPTSRHCVLCWVSLRALLSVG